MCSKSYGNTSVHGMFSSSSKRRILSLSFNFRIETFNRCGEDLKSYTGNYASLTVNAARGSCTLSHFVSDRVPSFRCGGSVGLGQLVNTFDDPTMVGVPLRWDGSRRD